MKIGDKVRFLDTVGGGIVKAFQGKDIVIVDNDGFDTPVLIRDCVIIESANEVQVRQSVKSDTTLVANVTKKIDVEPEIKIEETKEGEQVTVCIAYLPVDIKQINTTGYEAYLVNDSNYYLSYNYMGRGLRFWKPVTIVVWPGPEAAQSMTGYEISSLVKLSSAKKRTG